MARHLIVSEPFADYSRGDRITDSDVIAELLASDQADKLIPIEVEDHNEDEAPVVELVEPRGDDPPEETLSPSAPG